MKRIVPVGFVMLAVGFGLGWVCKPAASTEKSTAAGKPTASVSATSTNVKKAETATAEPLPSKVEKREPVDKAKVDQKEQIRKMQSQMSKQMTERMRAKFEKQIEKLAAGLNLTDAQKASLTAWLDDRMAKLGDVDFSNPKSMQSFSETLKTMTSKAMEDQLQASLTPDQKTALTDYKEKEIHAKADTLALKNLSKLQTAVEFVDGQRDEVYKILTEDAEKKAGEEETAADLAKLMTEGMGEDTDPYDLGIQSLMGKMGEAEESGGARKNGKETAQAIREAIDQSIEAKVDLLRPVLNENQLDQYRKELKTNGLGMMGPMLDAMEAGGK